jgi:hypothetical protein
MTPNPRRIAGGLAAAVLGSGVTAALLLAPAATSASPPSTDVTSSDVTSSDDTATGSATDDAETARGDALRETLQPLVDAGALTADQADAIVAELLDMSGRRFELEIGPDVMLAPGFPAPPEMPGGRPDHGPFGGRLRPFNVEAIADAIGIDESELIDQLRQGETVAEIAEANGVDTQTVIDALVDEYTQRVTDWVTGEDSSVDEESAPTTPTTETAA